MRRPFFFSSLTSVIFVLCNNVEVNEIFRKILKSFSRVLPRISSYVCSAPGGNGLCVNEYSMVNSCISEPDGSPETVEFTTPENNFCRARTPYYASSYDSSEDEVKWIKMIEYDEVDDRFIKVEVRKCGYDLPDGTTEYHYYARSPDGSNMYYEVRRWDFKHNENASWVIWDKAIP